MRRRDDDVEAAARSSGSTSTVPSARMFASTPCSSRNDPVAVAVQPIDLDALRGEARRRQAVGDRQAARVIGDRAERRSRARGRPRRWPRASGCRRSTSSASADRRGSRRARARRGWRRRARPGRGRGSGSAPRKRAAALDLGAAAAARRRRASTIADSPVRSTSRMTRVDAGPMRGIRASVPSGLDERSIGSSRASDGLRGLLVAPRPLRRGLRGRQVAQQAGDDQVGVDRLDRLGATASGPSSPAATARRRERRLRRARDHLAVRREARAVARAVPRPLGGVPADEAPHVRADRRAQRHDAVLVAIGGDRLAVVVDDLALPARAPRAAIGPRRRRSDRAPGSTGSPCSP